MGEAYSEAGWDIAFGPWCHEWWLGRNSKSPHVPAHWQEDSECASLHMHWHDGTPSLPVRRHCGGTSVHAAHALIRA